MNVQAAASRSQEAAAKAKCKSARAVRGNISTAEVTSLMDACTPAMSSPLVVEEFMDTIDAVCYGRPVNTLTCSAAGVIPAVLDAMAAHPAFGSGNGARR